MSRVEPQFVELGGDVVVVLNVLCREPELVVLLAPAQRPPGLPQRFLNRMRGQPGPIDGKQQQQVIDLAAILHDQATVHIGLCRLQFRIEENLAFDRLVGQPDGDVGTTFATAEGLLETVLEDDGQAAVLDEPGEQIWQQMHQELIPSAWP